jgi:hypothetical protein
MTGQSQGQTGYLVHIHVRVLVLMNNSTAMGALRFWDMNPFK